jgi:hypothetical protein
MRVAFDVDGTLFDEEGQPRWDVIQILRNLVPYCTVIVWSGSGLSYAKAKGRALFLPPEVIYWSKGSQPADISFDDQDVTLAKVNINVGRTHGQAEATAERASDPDQEA